MHVVHLDDKGVDVADLIVEIVVEAGFVGCYKVEHAGENIAGRALWTGRARI